MIPRRTLLAGAAAGAALAAMAGRPRTGRVVDVRAFGAQGDGVADDSTAIRVATASMRSGDTLYFSRGVYRFAQRWPPGGAAIVLAGLSDVGVVFEAGARLHMDNVDPDANTGTGHGLLVTGPASRIHLRNIDIRWTTRAVRSLGDGIRVAGWPGPGAHVDGVTLADCVIHGSPQAGVIMLGAADISVSGLRVHDTGADGLHFNACRRATVSDCRAVDPGDDGVALVTYFATEFAVDDDAHTFALPALTDWSNTGIRLRSVEVIGGAANGVRIAGAQGVEVRDLNVDGVRQGAALMVDSADPRAGARWSYLASRDIRVRDVAARRCDTGIHLLARPAGDRRFSDFDVHIADAEFDDCHNWSVRAESLSAQKASGLRIDRCEVTATSTTGGHGGVGTANTTGIALGAVTIRHSEPVVTLSAVGADGFAVDRLHVSIDKPDDPDGRAQPAVSLADSRCALPAVEVAWSAAPAWWQSVRLHGDSEISR